MSPVDVSFDAVYNKARRWDWGKTTDGLFTSLSSYKAPHDIRQHEYWIREHSRTVVRTWISNVRRRLLHLISVPIGMLLFTDRIYRFAAPFQKLAWLITDFLSWKNCKWSRQCVIFLWKRWRKPLEVGSSQQRRYFTRHASPTCSTQIHEHRFRVRLLLWNDSSTYKSAAIRLRSKYSRSVIWFFIDCSCWLRMNATARSNGAFIAHTLASNNDASILMSGQLIESLLQYKKFNHSEVLSRYLFLYHTERCALGKTITEMHKVILDMLTNRYHDSSLTRQDFLINRSTIDKAVKLVDNNLHGQTAGCGPAHRSFPLALCPAIKDEDLFERSMEEAQLTHASPIAGQVAGIVNLICRALLRDQTWDEAIESAFAVPRLHDDLLDVWTSHSRSHCPDPDSNSAYAPNSLHAALYYISNSNDTLGAIRKARSENDFSCLPIVGILAGTLWGVPPLIQREHSGNPQMTSMLQAANTFAYVWDTPYSSVKAWQLPEEISAILGIFLYQTARLDSLPNKRNFTSRRIASHSK